MYLPKIQKRSGQDSNLRGQSPIDFKSIALTTRPPDLLYKNLYSIVFYLVNNNFIIILFFTIRYFQIHLHHVQCYSIRKNES